MEVRPGDGQAAADQAALRQEAGRPRLAGHQEGAQDDDMLKHVPAGCGVSYGHTFITSRSSSIGVLPVGYADGYRRGLQMGGEVMIRGRRAPVVGAICMDLTMIDLTEVPAARIGDEVTLWGGAGEAMISVNDVARLAQTISYEMLCTVGRRVPRVYRR